MPAVTTRSWDRDPWPTQSTAGAWWEWALVVLLLAAVLGPAYVVGQRHQDQRQRAERACRDVLHIPAAQIRACARDLTQPTTTSTRTTP